MRNDTDQVAVGQILGPTLKVILDLFIIRVRFDPITGLTHLKDHKGNRDRQILRL
jgi:hypothetical protein